MTPILIAIYLTGLFCTFSCLCFDENSRNMTVESFVVALLWPITISANWFVVGYLYCTSITVAYQMAKSKKPINE